MKSFSDHELIDRWITAEAVHVLPPEMTCGDAKLLGLVYVDHQCGITLDVAHCCKLDGEVVRLTKDFRAEGTSLKMRYGSFRPLRLVEAAERRRLSLAETPDWLARYNVKGLEPLRSSRFLDPLRAPGYPDDILVMLVQPGMKGIEGVWARMEGSTDGVHIDCTLLNQPLEPCDVSAGDRIVVVLMGGGEDPRAFYLGPAGSTLEQLADAPSSEWPKT